MKEKRKVAEYNYINSFFHHVDRLGSALNDILLIHEGGQDVKYRLKSYYIMAKFLEVLVSPHRTKDYMSKRDFFTKKYKAIPDDKLNREEQLEAIMDYIMLTMDLAYDAGLMEFKKVMYEDEVEEEYGRITAKDN